MPNSRFKSLLAAFLLAGVLPGTAMAQDRGTITGQVVDVATQAPLTAVRVTVVGTNLAALTNQEGQYSIGNVPAGTRQVRVTRIGYAEATESVDVQAGAMVTQDFQLRQSAVALEGLLVTATGDIQRIRERGNVVSQIQVRDLEQGSITRMADVLQGRSAGVVVQAPSGTTGTGARVRVRGSASASLSNEPLVIVDGVRVTNSAAAFSIGVGGQSISRLDDLAPEEIESIEILRGPAASALYGTAAATGVIQITTRRGQAGVARWNAYNEMGLILDRNEYPGNYLAVDETGAPCWTIRAAAGACEIAEVLSWNPLMDREEGHGVSNPELGPASPLRDGTRQLYGLNVAGGEERLTYFISGEFEDTRGVFRNNAMERVALRANIQGQLRDDLDMTLSTGWTNRESQIPWNDNATGGAIGDALTGSPRDDPETRGYSNASPDMMARLDTRQTGRRFTGSLNSTYRPLTWLSFSGTVGLDMVNRHDAQIVPPETLPFSDWPDGQRVSNRIEMGNITANLGATATYDLTSDIASTSSGGVQYHRETFRGTYGTGWELLAGTGSLAGTTARFSVDEENQDVVLLGTYVQQQFSWQDRIYVTGALRGDDSSAFGTGFGLAWYPSVSASWVTSEEAWFPENDIVNSVRLRGAFGRSGLRPGFRQAVTYFEPVGATVEGARDAVAFTVGGVGDPDLSPEVSTEIEGGFDLGLFNDRIGVEFTAYTKTSEDALVARRLAPSLGLATTRFENVGEVKNRGVEALVDGALVDLPGWRWNATVSLGTNTNELTRLDGDPIIFGLASGQQHREGYPLGGYWQRPITWEDPDGDGLLRLQDVTPGDEMEFAGTPFPTRNVSVGSDVTFRDLVRLNVLFEHQGGHTLWAGNEEWQCVFLLCEALNNPDTPLDRQARGIGTLQYFTWWGYLEDADFWKLREVSVTLMAPSDLVQGWGVSGLSLTVAGRNLATWTDFTGLDPEGNFAGSSNFTSAEFQSHPSVRHWTARVNVNF